MFGSIGGFEMLVLLVIGLLVFGPRKLPEIGRTLGKAIVEFRKAGMELKSSIEREVSLEELQEAGRSVGRDVGAGIESVKQGLVPRVPGLGDLAELGDLGKLAGEEPPGKAEDGGGGDAVRKD